MLLFLLCCSCKTTEYTNNVQEKVESSSIIQTIDSIEVRDSIYIYESPDTLYIYKEKVKVKYLQKIDTLLQNDTIYIAEQQIVKEEGKGLSVLEKVGITFIFILALLLVYFIWFRK